MSVLARRREAECASDLRFDRWLLGESPGSDEARQLEQHIATCGECASRLRALRSVYSGSTVVTGKPTPVRVAAAGLLQVIIVRDGLLVGTEMFSTGHWVVGAEGADLSLDGLSARQHASLRFHEGRVHVEPLGGPVFVNGNRVGVHELRPIDELQLGPWTLRTRVVSERWSHPQPVAPLPEVKTEIVHRPTASVLKLELRWGERTLAVRSFEPHEAVPGNVFEAHGAPVLRAQREGAYHRVSWGRSNGELVGPAAPLRLEHAGLMLCASVIEAEPKVGRGSVLQVPRSVLALMMVFACLPIGLGFVERPDDDVFEPRSIPPLPIKPVPPPAPQKPSAPSKAASAPAAKSKVRTSTRAKLPALPSGLLGSTAAIEQALKNLGPTRGAPSKSLLAGLPGSTASAFGSALPLGAAAYTPVGIGAAGVLTSNRIGHGGVMARVSERSVRVAGESGGSIDRDSVAKVIAAHTAEVSACYETALLSHEGLKGTAKLEWRIDGSGTVVSARLLGGTLRDAGAVTGCIMSRLKTWHFPPARGGVVVVSNNFVFEQAAY